MVSRDLRACLRASAAKSLRALTAVLRLHFATLAMAVSVAPGWAFSAARARSRGPSVDHGPARHVSGLRYIH